MGVAKGLAMALSIPLIAIPTLDIVAAAQPMSKGSLIAIAQAGRGRVCAGRYIWRKTAWAPLTAVEILGWDAVIASVEGDTLIAGEIDQAAQDLIAQSDKPIRLASPAFSLRRAGILADLALARRDLPSDPAAIVPIYVNQPGVPHP